jgi:hypothetical protein
VDTWASVESGGSSGLLLRPPYRIGLLLRGERVGSENVPNNGREKVVSYR